MARRRRRLWALLLGAACAVGGCRSSPRAEPARSPLPPAAAPESGVRTLPAPVVLAPTSVLPTASGERGQPDSAFGRLHATLSEAGGFFQSGNVVSNETSYLHVLDAIRRIGVRGGVYIGVGPDQNYSYIAAIRPSVAFILDIRRDNALEHLLFKAAFAMSRNRIEYLCVITGRPCPRDIDAWTDRPIVDIVRQIEATRAVPSFADSTQRELDRRVQAFGLGLDTKDSAIVVTYRNAFVREGLSVQYGSLDGKYQPSVPLWRDLLLETDRAGTQQNYLAADSAFRYVKSMHARNLIVPVIGNVAGPRAVAAIADEVRRRGETVTAFYMSNVEQYLMRDGSFPRFVENVRRLPRSDSSVIIRSLFTISFGVHPLRMNQHTSTSMMQFMNALLGEYDAGRIRSYEDVVFRAYIDR
jgi:hypothetical protein